MDRKLDGWVAWCKSLPLLVPAGHMTCAQRSCQPAGNYRSATPSEKSENLALVFIY